MKALTGILLLEGIRAQQEQEMAQMDVVVMIFEILLLLFAVTILCIIVGFFFNLYKKWIRENELNNEYERDFNRR